MYYLEKRLEVAGSHKLNLDYESKCQNIHGHNWIITVYCKSGSLNKNGMIIDFTDIKKIVMELDHSNLNDLFKINPTAENIARYIYEKLNEKIQKDNVEKFTYDISNEFATRTINPPCCYKVKVQESEGNIVTYEV